MPFCILGIEADMDIAILLCCLIPNIYWRYITFSTNLVGSSSNCRYKTIKFQIGITNDAFVFHSTSSKIASITGSINKCVTTI